MAQWQRIHLPTLELHETQVRPLGQEGPLEEEMTTHSSMRPLEISWTEEPGRQQSMDGISPSTEEQVNSRCAVYWVFLDNTHTHTHSIYSSSQQAPPRNADNSASTDWQMSLGTQTPCPCVQSHIINFITHSFLPWAFSFSPSVVTGHWQRPVILLLNQHTRKFVKCLKWLGKILVVTWDRKSSTLSTISQWFLI